MAKRSGTLKASVLAASVGALSLASTPASACSCIGTISGGTSTVTGLVAGGSAAIVTALQLGFDKTAAQVMSSEAKMAKDVVSAIEGMEKSLRTQIMMQPSLDESIQQQLDAASPSRHATNECEYIQRTGDSRAADQIVGAQQKELTDAVIAYNETPSRYPDTTDSEVAFGALVGKLIRDNPDIKTAPMKVIGGPDEIGAMTPQEFQTASRALNLTINPSPARKMQSPTTPTDIQSNVDADLYNMRMSVPQGISQNLLSYEAPLLDLPQDSWFTSILERMSPEEFTTFTGENRKISYSDLIRHMATHRMKDPATVASAATKEEQGLQKDLAMVKADHLAMDYEIWKLERYETLLMTQLLASQNRQERK